MRYSNFLEKGMFCFKKKCKRIRRFVGFTWAPGANQCPRNRNCKWSTEPLLESFLWIIYSRFFVVRFSLFSPVNKFINNFLVFFARNFKFTEKLAAYFCFFSSDDANRYETLKGRKKKSFTEQAERKHLTSDYCFVWNWSDIFTKCQSLVLAERNAKIFRYCFHSGEFAARKVAE